MNDIEKLSDTQEKKSNMDSLFEEMSDAQSGASKFFLGDDAKKAAKNEEALANAEMTRAIAKLATQMAQEPSNKKSSIGTTGLVLGILAGVAVLTVVIVVVAKKGSQAKVLPKPVAPAAMTV